MIEVVSLDQGEYTVVVHGGEGRGVPYTIYLNQVNNTTSGNYVYSIGKATTYLVEKDLNSIEQLVGYLQKKLNKPVYLNVNGTFPPVVETYKVLLELIEKIG